MRAGVLVLLSGCTHLTAVGGGVTDDDFYLITNKQFLVFSGRSVVLHCTRSSAAPVTCERVLTTPQAAAFSQNAYDDAYLACAYWAEVQFSYLAAPNLEEVAEDYSDSSEPAQRACVKGYADTWNDAARAWNADHPDDPYTLVRLPHQESRAAPSTSTSTPDTTPSE